MIKLSFPLWVCFALLAAKIGFAAEVPNIRYIDLVSIFMYNNFMKLQEFFNHSWDRNNTDIITRHERTCLVIRYRYTYHMYRYKSFVNSMLSIANEMISTFYRGTKIRVVYSEGSQGLGSAVYWHGSRVDLIPTNNSSPC